MIYLLNNERVVREILELSMLRLSGILGVEPSKIRVGLKVTDGKIVPEFNVEMEAAGALEEKYIQKAIADVWLLVAKPEMEARLRGMHEVRYGFKEIVPNARRLEDVSAKETGEESATEAPPKEASEGSDEKPTGQTPE